MSAFPYKKTSLALIISASACPALADTDNIDTEFRVTPSQMVQGGNGLIQTPTARMREEGGLAVNYTDNGEYRFWSVSNSYIHRVWLDTIERLGCLVNRRVGQLAELSGYWQTG